MRLFRTITLVLVLLTVAPVSLVGLILIQSSADTLKTLTWELQQERADHAGRAVSQFIEHIASDLDLLLSTFGVANMNLTQRQDLLAFVLQKRAEVNIIAFYDRQGHSLRNQLAFDSQRILPSELVDHQTQLADLRWSSPGEGEAVAISAPYTIRRAARPELGIDERRESAVALAIRINQGDVAMVGMEVSLTPLQKVLDKIRVGARGEVLLLDTRGTLVARRGNLTGLSLDPALLESLRRQVIAPQEEDGTLTLVSGARPLRVGAEQVLAAYAPLARLPWLMISLEPLDEAYAATRRMTWQVISVVLVSLAVAISLGILFVFNITRPISKCVTGALAIARGNFGFKLDVRVRNEVGELAHTFNYMSQQLQLFDQENRGLVASLEQGYLETIRALANSIDAKDPYTRGHSRRVTNVAIAVGRALGLDELDLRKLRYGGILHDIGKIGIQELILAKKGRLSDEERKIIQGHPVLGDKIIEPIDFLQPVRPIVLHHHEWFDGSGYPTGLKGENIPLLARIVNAADTYDAVTSERPYQKAVDNHEAILILKRLRTRQFDPRVCDAIIGVIEKRIEGGQIRPSEWTDENTDPTA